MKIALSALLPPLEKKAKIIYFVRISICAAISIIVLLSGLNPFESLTAIFAVLGLIFRINATYPLAIGLFFLVTTPVFIELNRREWSDHTVVYAFYFLAIGTISALFEKHPVKYYKNNTPRRTSHSIEDPTTINAQDVLSSSEKVPSQMPAISPLPQTQLPTSANQEIQKHPKTKPPTKRRLIQG